MYCSECGNELRDESRFCDKCGYQLKKSSNIDDETRMKQKNKKRKKASLVSVVSLLIIIIIGIVIYNEHMPVEKSNTSDKIEAKDLTMFTNEREREPIDPMEYGKDTPEEVLVELIQGVCDADIERYMHVILPDLWNELTGPIDWVDKETDYQEYLSYVEDMSKGEGIFSNPCNTWECHIIDKKMWSEDEIEQWNAAYKARGYENTEITDGMTIDFRFDADEKEWLEEEGRLDEQPVYVCKTADGKWFACI